MIRRSDERGAVAVLTALLVIVLVSMMAFTADFGMAYAQRQALSTGVDSASLRIVQTEYKKQVSNPTRTCPQILAEDTARAASDPAKATNVALDQINRNAPFGAALTASDVTVELKCVFSGVLQASVGVARTVPRTFGLMMGSEPLVVRRTSVADLGVRNKVKGVEPLGICNLQAQSIVDNAAADLAAAQPVRAELISLEKIWGASGNCAGSGGAGNWGWLDLGQGNGASALGDMIASGSPTVTLTGSPPSYSMNGTPGNKASSTQVKQGMATIMDKVVTLPVYSTYTESGSNVTYTVNGFLTVKMCGYDMTVKGACYDPSVPMVGNDMQVKFVAHSTSGQIGTASGIGDANAFNSYVTGLVE